jgi:hypothetical protein
MKRVATLALSLATLFPDSVNAGALYGTVRSGPTPVANATVLVACPGFDSPGHQRGQGATDGRGSFSLRVASTGRCQMQVQRAGLNGAPFPVSVSDNVMRFDFEVDAALNKVR